MLELLKSDPPFRRITFNFISLLLCNLVYNKKMHSSLKPEHYKLLIDGYVVSIKGVRKYL